VGDAFEGDSWIGAVADPDVVAQARRHGHADLLRERIDGAVGE
jgi:hypothetical protein